MTKERFLINYGKFRQWRGEKLINTQELSEWSLKSVKVCECRFHWLYVISSSFITKENLFSSWESAANYLRLLSSFWCSAGKAPHQVSTKRRRPTVWSGEIKWHFPYSSKTFILPDTHSQLNNQGCRYVFVFFPPKIDRSRNDKVMLKKNKWSAAIPSYFSCPSLLVDFLSSSVRP